MTIDPPRLDLTGFAEWLVDRGLQGLPLEEQVDGFCRRVVEAGFPARRFNMLLGTLHPRHGARAYIWHPDGLTTDAFPRRRSDEESEAYMRSPIYLLRRTRRDEVAPAPRQRARRMISRCSPTCARPG